MVFLSSIIPQSSITIKPQLIFTNQYFNNSVGIGIGYENAFSNTFGIAASFNVYSPSLRFEGTEKMTGIFTSLLIGPVWKYHFNNRIVTYISPAIGYFTYNHSWPGHAVINDDGSSVYEEEIENHIGFAIQTGVCFFNTFDLSLNYNIAKTKLIRHGTTGIVDGEYNTENEININRLVLSVGLRFAL